MVSFLLKNCRDRNYAEATEILDRELATWNGQVYGYTAAYLIKSTNLSEFSSSAKVPAMIRLGKLDREKGSTLYDLFYLCCRYFPKKAAIQGLIENEKTTQGETAKKMFEFRNSTDSNCLIAMFEMATRYNLTTGRDPVGEMLSEIEDSIFYLIDLAERHNLDVAGILNHTAKNGDTLFTQASFLSKRVCRYLLEKGVKVNSIDNLFRTPGFKVSF